MKDFLRENKSTARVDTASRPHPLSPAKPGQPSRRPGRSNADDSSRPSRRGYPDAPSSGDQPYLPRVKDSRPYRENVVGFILNRRNDVLIMKRAGARWHWQLPQGGVEPTETKRQAVLREMREETGLHGIRIIGVVENFHMYDWPRAPLYARDEYRGQRQTLFFLRYTAKGLGVSLDPKEATGSRWVPIKDLLKWLAPVRHAMAKKTLYYYQQLFKVKKV